MAPPAGRRPLPDAHRERADDTRYPASLGQTAYAKGDFPCLFGKIGGGLVNISFFTFLFLFLPKTVGSAGIQSTGLLSLIYLAVGLSYLYLVLDFIDARRTKAVTT